MLFLLLLAVCFITSFVITKVVVKYANKIKLMDHPVARSSHDISTPRGGGVSIVFVFILSLIYLNRSSELDNSMLLSFVSGGLLVSIIGFWDDIQNLSRKVRVLVHIIAGVVSLSFLSELPEIVIFNLYLNNQILLFPFYTVVLVWLLNLYNFMDGIDGIASVEAIAVLIGASLILVLHGDFNTPKVFLVLSSTISGFLIWNWPPVKIFMGDVCSGFIGFIIGLFIITSIRSEFINAWVWLILLAVFIVDATYTLVRRFIHGNTWYGAHRSHAYQILSRKYKSHKKITTSVLVVNIVWLYPFAYLASIYEFWAPLISLIALLPLILIEFKVKAGLLDD